jgi:hypothetical protein
VILLIVRIEFILQQIVGKREISAMELVGKLKWQGLGTGVSSLSTVRVAFFLFIVTGETYRFFDILEISESFWVMALC